MTTLIITALQAEAKPIIERLELRRCDARPDLQLFQKENTFLLISGVGAPKVEKNLRALFSYHLLPTPYSLLNLGICAAPPTSPLGSLYEVRKVTCETSGQEWELPCGTSPPPLPLAHLVSVASPVPDMSRYASLVDMEAAAILRSAQEFSQPAQARILKVVSDHGTTKLLATDEIEKLISRCLPYLVRSSG